ncbi:uncharacterized protein METZ01_LOCUS245071 [marine metagenome]|uniref:Uncharacterized protein n=1 Tax=marine metagenome TaxID=408172 RepID=A0A382HZ33_9ZZZZ
MSDAEFQHDVAENFLLPSKTCTSPASASEKLCLRVVTARFTIQSQLINHCAHLSHANVTKSDSNGLEWTPVSPVWVKVGFFHIRGSSN